MNQPPLTLIACPFMYPFLASISHFRDLFRRSVSAYRDVVPSRVRIGCHHLGFH